MNISWKINLSIAIAIITSIAISTIIIGNRSALTVKDLAYSLATEQAQHHGQAIQNELELNMGIVTSLSINFAELVALKHTDRQLINQILVSTVKSNPDSLLGAWMLWEPNAFDGHDQNFINAPMHDDTGRVNSYWHWDDNGELVLENNVDWENASWYNEPRKAGAPILLDPYIYKVSGVDTMLISLIAPIQINGEFSGVVGLDYKLTTLQDKISQLRFLDQGHAALIANDGTYIAHIDQTSIGKNISASVNKKEQLTAIQQGKHFVDIAEDSRYGEEVHRIYTPIVIGSGGSPWSLEITTPSRLLTGLSTELKQFILIAGTLSLIIVILIILFLFKHIVASPLSVLENAVKQFGSRSTRITVPVKTNDEIGTLSHSFNEMAEKIEHGRKELEAAESSIRAINEELEARVEKRTNDLEKANKELANAMEEAKQASLSKSSFLANMSHEIRTPLNGVIGMVELLNDSPLNKEQQQYTHVIKSSGNMLLTVINDILDYSKIEAKKLHLENIPFNLNTLVEDLITPFRLPHKPELQFIAFIDPAVPYHLFGDTTRLQQLLSNFLSNAFKFTQQGLITLKISCNEKKLERANITFSIADTGIGIPIDQQADLFQPFNQADMSTTRNFGGTGLGLAICKQLIDLMGGTIQLSSKQGKGSCFSFTIPLTINNNPGTEFNTIDLNNKKLLILDDMTLFHTIIGNQAKSLNMKVDAVTSAKALIHLLDNIENDADLPDIIMVDLEVPGSDVFSLAKTLASNSRYRTIPRILMTSSCIKPEKEKIQHFSASYYKPLSACTLKQMIGTTLGFATPDLHEDEKHLNNLATRSNHNIEVLVAEDNRVNQMVADGILKKIGIEANFVANGLQAVNTYKAKPGFYNVILMDCEMPEMDGYTAAQQIRQYEKANDLSPVPIYAFSAHVLPEVIQRCHNAGMDGHLAKPIDATELIHVINALPTTDA